MLAAWITLMFLTGYAALCHACRLGWALVERDIALVLAHGIMMWVSTWLAVNAFGIAKEQARDAR